jgi:hypothetical protein
LWLRLLATALGLVAGAAAADTPWHEPAAMFRYVLTLPPSEPTNTRVGYVEFCTGSEPETNCALALCTSEGVSVGFRELWRAEGDPVKLLFDCSAGAGPYVLYAGGAITSQAPEWQPSAGLVLETRATVRPYLHSVKDFRKEWDRSPQRFGCVLQSNVFQGLNPCGPWTNFLARYTGTFLAGQSGTYGFATVSDESSFFLVDGQTVAQWPGRHGANDGRSGVHSGEVVLAAGPHELEYLHSQGDGPSAAVAAWRPPGAGYPVVMPPAVFPPVARFGVAAWEVSAGAPEAVALGWELLDQLAEDDYALVKVGFEAGLAGQSAECRWRFDDGTEAAGSRVTHLFLRPGLREVVLEIRRGSSPVLTCRRRVNVHRLWDQTQGKTPRLEDWEKHALKDYDLTRMPLEDILYCFRWADQADERAVLPRVSDELVRRASALSAASADILVRLADYYVRPEVRQPERAEACRRKLREFVAAGTSLDDAAKLTLADWLINGIGSPAEAETLLQGMSPGSSALQRRRDILLADASLLKGDVDQARSGYLALGKPRDPRSHEVWRRSRLGYAADLVRRKEWAAVAGLLQRLQGQWPIERMSVETGLLAVQVHLGRQEYAQALTRCRALEFAVFSDQDQAELLYARAQVYEALNETGARADCVARLLREHPYSEAAARAEGQWPGSGSGQDIKGTGKRK